MFELFVVVEICWMMDGFYQESPSLEITSKNEPRVVMCSQRKVPTKIEAWRMMHKYEAKQAKQRPYLPLYAS
jgi:hypothetical protein